MLYEEAVTRQIIGAAIEVHRTLGPGLLESAYQSCLAREFLLLKLAFEQQKSLPVEYKGIHVDCGYRLDFIIAKKVILELKTMETIQTIHETQLLTYLKLTGLRVGLLINFNVVVLKDGIKRMVR